jgi:DNA-binding CsgD family transcriptional regulator
MSGVGASLAPPIDPRGTVFGRERELAALGDFLARAARSLAVLAMEGEAGVGKTTLWEAASAAAAERGFIQLTSRPVAAEVGLALAGLTDLFGGVDEQIVARLPPPQRRALEITLLRAEPVGDAPDQLAVSVAAARLLGELAERDRPVLVAIDDVQWLDTSSAAILAFAIRRLRDRPIGVLLTQRSGHAGGPSVLEGAVATGRRDRIVIGPLPLAALQRLLTARLGRSVPRFALIRIERISGGNAFYALEIARALVLSGTSLGAEDALPVPGSLGDLLVARLERLPPRTRKLLLVAAAAIEPSLETLAKTGATDPRRSLRPAIAESIVSVEAELVRFTHPLLATGVLASADAAAVRAVHASLAEVATSEEARARHLGRAADGADEQAAQALEAASSQASARGANQAAAELAELAAELTPDDRAQDRWRRWLAAAQHAFDAGSPVEARSLVERTTAEMPPGPVRASALLRLAKIVNYGDGAGALRLLKRALAEAGEHGELRGEIHAEMAWAADTNFDLGIQHADQAIALLDEARQPGQISYALSAKMYMSLLAGRGAQLELGERAVQLERRARPPRTAERAEFWLSVALKDVDRLDEARCLLSAIHDDAARAGDEWSRSEILSILEQLELRAGRMDLAERYVREKRELLQISGFQHVTWSSAGTPTRLDAIAGRIDEARTQARDALRGLAESRDEWSMLNVLPSAGFAELTAGEDCAAEAHLSRADELAEALGVLEPNRLRLHADLIEVLVRLGELDRARRVLERFTTRALRHRFAWSMATSARCRGLLAAARGDQDDALAALDEALAHGATLPDPLEHARTLLVKGQVHRRRKERRKADETLREALSLFEQIGSPPWVERTHAELARVGLRPRAGAQLTETERRVAELAATGLSSRQIAEAAFLSQKTVGNVLTRVYHKLGIRSRAELGARMATSEEAAGDR